MPQANHRWTLAARPTGMPVATDFRFETTTLRDPADGEILVKNQYISLDPAMRGWMNDVRSYIRPIALGEVFRAVAIGKVLASRNPSFPEGSHVTGMFGVQDYAISNGEGVTLVDPRLAPLPVQLGALGMPGITAYFGLLDTGKPRAGDTVVVSGAAGAVGSVVGQLAKLKGCRVIGIAGGAAKCAYLGTLGYDVAIDYKAGSVKAALREHCPTGIDIYFDNVGGDILDAALTQLALHARVVVCGAISQYNTTTSVKGPSNYLALLVTRSSMTGMVVFDYAPRYAEAVRELAGWYAAGKLASKEDIVRGIDTFPATLLKLFTGENFGKLLLEVA